MEKFFKIKERGSTLKTEIFAGITTFFAMAYIIFVNPNQVAAEGANGWLVGLGADPGTMGQIWNSVYIASIIVAIIGTLQICRLHRRVEWDSIPSSVQSS